MTEPRKTVHSEGKRMRRLPAYALAIVATAATLALRLAIHEMLGQRPTLVIFTLPIVFSAAEGGLGPGLFATGLSYLAASYFLLPPLYRFAVASTAERWQQFFVVLCGVVISVLCESLHRTRRRQVESDELFAKAFQLSPDCVVITRVADRIVVRANDALCRLWGSTPEAVIGRPGPDYTEWLREDERLAFMQALKDQGERLNCETTFRMTDGRLLEFNVSSRLITLDGAPCALTVMRDITARKQAEAASAQLTSIIAFSDDAIIGKSLEGVITSWNSGAEKIFGYSAAEAIGQPMLLLIPPERRAEEPDILARIARGEHVQHFETVRIRKDGRRIDISATISPIADATGRIIGASKIARDVTLRKAHEHEISRLSQLYAALSHVNQAIVVKRSREELFPEICRALVEAGGFRLAWIGWLDPQTRCVRAVAQCGDTHNLTARAEINVDDHTGPQGLTGLAVREGRSQVCNDFSTDPRIAPWRDALTEMGYRSSAVFPIHLAGVTCGSIAVSAGEVDFFRAREIALLEEAASDVSFALDNFAREDARRQAETKLEEERTLLRTLFDLLPDYVYIKDAGSRFLACNQHCAARFGVESNRDLIGKTDADFFSPESAAKFRADELAVLDGASILNREESFVRPDGVRETILTNKLPLRDAAGKITGIIGCGREITELKKTEEALQQREEQLRLYVEHSPAAVAMFDRHMNYLVVSHRWMEDYHLGEQSIVGRSHYEVFPDLPPRWIEIHRRCLAGAVEKCAEDAYLRANGTTGWLGWEIRPWHLPGGAIGGIIIFSEDITERKRTAEKVREQLDELLRWQEVMLNREDRVQALKAEVNELLSRQNEPPRYSGSTAP